MKLAILCFGLCSPPAIIHCHQFGEQQNCFVQGNGKAHVLKASGLPPDGIPFNGKSSWGFSLAGLPELKEVKIDGKVVRVKR